MAGFALRIFMYTSLFGSCVVVNHVCLCSIEHHGLRRSTSFEVLKGTLQSKLLYLPLDDNIALVGACG